MPPRPFRQSLSIGSDICHHPRFSKYFPTHQHLPSTTTAITSQTPLFKLFDKALLPAEQRAFWRRFQNSAIPSGSKNSSASSEGAEAFWTEKKAEEATKYLGGRWAAKEAVIKAFSPKRRLVLRDVRIWSAGSGKQPLAIVIDDVAADAKRYDSARRVYEKWQRQKELGEQMKVLLKQRFGDSVAAPGGGFRIIKKPVLKRYEARVLEMKKVGLQQQEGTETLTQQRQGESGNASVSSTATPSILSKNGTLDLNAVTDILNQQDEPPSSSSSTSVTAPQTSEEDERSQQSQQDRLQEELDKILREEQEEDDWENAQGQIVKLSISHDGKYCVATALAAV